MGGLLPVARLVAVVSFAGLGALLAGAGCGDDAVTGDEQELAECGGARLDANDICRKQNGQFAKAYCCNCRDVAPNLAGECVRADGSAAPTACCEDLCGGASLDAGGQCRKDNGQFALSTCCADECATLEASGSSVASLPSCTAGAAECQGAALDDHGTCRKPNGQFAKSACCNASCKDTALDESGQCRNTVTGRFAPASCCADACEGAALDASGVCRKPNGQFAQNACCADECFEDQEGGSSTAEACLGCAHSECEAGGPLDETCSPCAAEVCVDDPYCCTTDWDSICTQYAFERCEDKCGALLGSCQDRCDSIGHGSSCWCDALCHELGDCCDDKVALCGGS